MALTGWLHGSSVTRSLHPWAASDEKKARRFQKPKQNKTEHFAVKKITGKRRMPSWSRSPQRSLAAVGPADAAQ